MQRDLKQQITPRESGARHEEDPPVDADPERSSGNHAHGIPGGSAYSTNRRIHGWPVCVRHAGCLHRAVGRDRTWRVPPRQLALVDWVARAGTGSVVVSGAGSHTGWHDSQGWFSGKQKGIYQLFFLLLNNAKSNKNICKSKKEMNYSSMEEKNEHNSKKH